MTVKGFFTFLFNIFVHYMKVIFKPEPDSRYMLKYKNGLVTNDVDDKHISPVSIHPDYILEIYYDGKLLNTFTTSIENGKVVHFGLPIFCNHEIEVKIVDSIDYEVVKSYPYKQGEIVDYKLIMKELKIFQHLNHQKVD